MSTPLLQSQKDIEYGGLDEVEEAEHGRILYRASFVEHEEEFVRYRTWMLILGSIILIPIYGLGLFLLLWTPILRSNARAELRSRRLYVTTENIVFKQAAPACCPCLGVNKIEKHILLPLITDVVLTQGWFEAWFGLWTVSIENAGQGGGGGKHQVSPDLKIQGLHEAEIFKKILLRAATAKRAGLQFTMDDVQAVITHRSLPPLPSNGPANSAYQTAPIGYPPSYAPVPAASSQEIQAMNFTLGRMEKLLEKLVEVTVSQHPTTATTISSSSTLPYPSFQPPTSQDSLINY